MVGLGTVFVYAGFRGYSVLAVLQNLVTGKPIFTDVSVVNPLQSFGTVANPSDTTIPSELGTTNVTGSGGSPKGNKALGQSMAAAMGWTGAEWDALDKLWTRESSWNNRADNPSSHAYGIPQSLPYSKMPQMAWPESAGGSSDAAAQISWGLTYIQGRYGTPVMAWAHEQANGWY